MKVQVWRDKNRFAFIPTLECQWDGDLGYYDLYIGWFVWFVEISLWRKK